MLLFGADTTLMQMLGGFLVVAGVGLIQIHSMRRKPGAEAGRRWRLSAGGVPRDAAG